MRDTAGREGARTAHAVRSAYEEATNDIAQMVATASERLTSTSGEMRTVAQQLVSELEATREEVRRGVFELPQEAQESAAAMRRAVADQIKALNELSEIVSRHGGSLDTSVPPTQPHGRPSLGSGAGLGASLGGGASRGGGFDDLLTGRGGRGPREPVERVERRTTRRPERLDERYDDRYDDVTTSADLVSRSEVRDPSHILESLNATAVDIVRAVNDDAFEDLFRRYRRGESNVFIRRLLALRDRGIAEDVRRRYRRDGEARDAVDRFLDGFEELLAQISETDRDGVFRQMYLTSEPSKVYSMLADAIGRPN